MNTVKLIFLNLVLAASASLCQALDPADEAKFNPAYSAFKDSGSESAAAPVVDSWHENGCPTCEKDAPSRAINGFAKDSDKSPIGLDTNPTPKAGTN